jgi:hypothetical protein
MKVVIPDEVLTILQSFKRINNGICFNTDFTSVASEYGLGFGWYKGFKMPKEFALSSVQKMISSFKALGTNEMELHENYLVIKNEDKEKIKLAYTDPSFIKRLSVDFEEKIPDHDLVLEINVDLLKQMKTISDRISLNSIRFNVNQDNVKVEALTLTQTQLFDYDGDMMEISLPIKERLGNYADFSVGLKWSDIDLVEGSYDVHLSERTVMFKSLDIEGLNYMFVGIEAGD